MYKNTRNNNKEYLTYTEEEQNIMKEIDSLMKPIREYLSNKVYEEDYEIGIISNFLHEGLFETILTVKIGL